MSAIESVVALLRKQIDDRVDCLELQRKQHKIAGHKPGCFCQEFIDREAEAIEQDRAALVEIEATL